MKINITRIDGTKIELDGDADELNKVIGSLIPVQFSWPYSYTLLDGNEIRPSSLCDHTYPSPWFGVHSPKCTKCGA